jgi:alkylation response protein AidB-like acyl-CoA dehydrogenase
MEFHDSPEEATFRTQVREFIASELPKHVAPGQPAPGPEDDPQAHAGWRKALAQKGWIAPHWPKEYGGAGMSVSEQFVFNEEMADARAPQVGGMGVQMIGPILINFGTDEQKAEHLPRITNGDVVWCQGYSEPGSGSDLASLQTRAVRDGDDFVINGQKIWTSGAHRADWMFLLARTDPDAPKHRGISMFLMDMKSPGIQVQPLITMANDHVFNQEYFDNVRVPAKNLVGDENRGWYVGAALLDFERSNIAGSIGLKHTVNDIIRYVKEEKVQLPDHVKTEIADRAVEAEIARLISYRVITMQKRGQIPNYEASMNKLYRSEANQRIAGTAVKILGMNGGLYRGEDKAPLDGRFSHMYVSSVSGTIAAGTSEINRNVIATRGLGLPRG